MCTVRGVGKALGQMKEARGPGFRSHMAWEVTRTEVGTGREFDIGRDPLRNCKSYQGILHPGEQAPPHPRVTYMHPEAQHVIVLGISVSAEVRSEDKAVMD